MMRGERGVDRPRQPPEAQFGGRCIPIRVECYAGARADETPRRFIWAERRIEVDEVLDCWHQVESRPGWPRADYFRVRGADRHDYLLTHDLESDDWFLRPDR